MSPLPDPVVALRHAGGSCPVYVSRGLLSRLGDLVERHLPGRRVVVIADDRVAALVGHPLDAPTFSFPAGEASKTRAEWSRLTDLLLDAGAGRDTAIVALGGGVTGDLAGFVAATLHRGVPVLQVPTSLLAMVDAAIGGKTGVDTTAGKNLVGAFHQPAAVLADPGVLGTLPPVELRTGLAEVVKHALVADAGHFAWLDREQAALRDRNPQVLEQAIRRSVEIKCAVVAGDERDSGRRAVLNAGHTVAHGLEHASGFTLPHGEAVAIGLVAEASAGEDLGHTERGTADRVAGLLGALQLPVAAPEGLDRAGALEAMWLDKKNREGTLRCALPRRIGTMAGSDRDGWTQGVPQDVLYLKTFESGR